MHTGRQTEACLAGDDTACVWRSTVWLVARRGGWSLGQVRSGLHKGAPCAPASQPQRDIGRAGQECTGQEIGGIRGRGRGRVWLWWEICLLVPRSDVL